MQRPKAAPGLEHILHRAVQHIESMQPNRSLIIFHHLGEAVEPVYAHDQAGQHDHAQGDQGFPVLSQPGPYRTQAEPGHEGQQVKQDTGDPLGEEIPMLGVVIPRPQ